MKNEQTTLGKTANPFLVSSRQENYDVLLDMIKQSHHDVIIFSHSLDGQLYDTSEFAENLSPLFQALQTGSAGGGMVRLLNGHGRGQFVGFFVHNLGATQEKVFPRVGHGSFDRGALVGFLDSSASKLSSSALAAALVRLFTPSLLNICLLYHLMVP